MRLVSVLSSRLLADFCRSRHPAYLIGTLKSPPVRAIRKSVPPEVSPNFPPCPVRYAPAERDFFFVPSGRDWRSPKLKKETSND